MVAVEKKLHPTYPGVLEVLAGYFNLGPHSPCIVRLRSLSEIWLRLDGCSWFSDRCLVAPHMPTSCLAQLTPEVRTGSANRFARKLPAHNCSKKITAGRVKLCLRWTIFLVGAVLWVGQPSPNLHVVESSPTEQFVLIADEIHLALWSEREDLNGYQLLNGDIQYEISGDRNKKRHVRWLIGCCCSKTVWIWRENSSCSQGVLLKMPPEVSMLHCEMTFVARLPKQPITTSKIQPQQLSTFSQYIKPFVQTYPSFTQQPFGVLAIEASKMKVSFFWHFRHKWQPKSSWKKQAWLKSNKWNTF